MTSDRSGRWALLALLRLGSIFGYRRIFLIGLGAFTLAPLACGLVPESLSLVGARIVQGAGAALMVPQVLSAIQTCFSGSARSHALALYPVALAGGAAGGQVLGGALIAADVAGSGWRSILFVNVPVGVALIAGAIASYLPTRVAGGSSWISGALQPCLPRWSCSSCR